MEEERHDYRRILLIIALIVLVIVLGISLFNKPSSKSTVKKETTSTKVSKATKTNVTKYLASLATSKKLTLKEIKHDYSDYSDSYLITITKYENGNLLADYMSTLHDIKVNKTNIHYVFAYYGLINDKIAVKASMQLKLKKEDNKYNCYLRDKVLGSCTMNNTFSFNMKSKDFNKILYKQINSVKANDFDTQGQVEKWKFYEAKDSSNQTSNNASQFSPGNAGDKYSLVDDNEDYNVNEYSDPDSFYSDNEEYFSDNEEAYEYYNEYHDE